MFRFIAPTHATHVELELDGSTISHISNALSKYPNNSSFHNWDSWTLWSTNMECVVVEYVWPLTNWIPWELMFPPIAELQLLYSWIDHFVLSAMSRSILLGQLLYVWNLSTGCMWELVHLQHSSGVLTILVAFLMAYLSTLIHTSAVSQLIFSEKVGLWNEGCFWSKQWK